MTDFEIVVDHREKTPYLFPSIDNKYISEERLPVGDYTIRGFEDIFAVERKTLDDLATSLGSDRLRFENEIRRANGYANRNEDGNPIPGTKPDQPLEEFVVVIEASKEDVYEYAGTGRCPNYYSRIVPNAVIGTVEKWPDKHDNLSFEWCGSRTEAERETLRILDKWYIKYLTE